MYHTALSHTALVPQSTYPTALSPTSLLPLTLLVLQNTYMTALILQPCILQTLLPLVQQTTLSVGTIAAQTETLTCCNELVSVFKGHGSETPTEVLL